MNKVLDDWSVSFKEEKVNTSSFKPDGNILLHPSLPPALHGTCPRTVMGRKWWDVKRKEAYAKHDYKCYACGVEKAESLGIANRLDAHEEYEIRMEDKRTKLTGIVALCTICHSFIHRNRMNNLYDQGKMTEFDCWEILSHGQRTLDNQGIVEEKTVNDYGGGDWEEWRLIIDGKEIEGQFSCRKEWEEY